MKNLVVGQVLKVVNSMYSDYYGDFMTFIYRDVSVVNGMMFLTPKKGVCYISPDGLKIGIGRGAFELLTESDTP